MQHSGKADSVNGKTTPGNQFIIQGHKIRIAENTPSKIIGIIPALPGSPIKIEIRTQFAGSGSNFLKPPRVITSSFTLTED